MTNEEYLETQIVLLKAAKTLRTLDLKKFLERIERAELLAPILNPTLYRLGAEQLGKIRRLTVAAIVLAELSDNTHGIIIEEKPNEKD
jgi:hypothetical protein